MPHQPNRFRREGMLVCAAPDQVSCELGGEAAILNLKTGAYFGLDPVGARIWSLISEPRTVEGIRDAIVEEYAVEPERCERDLLALLEKLADAGLVDTRVA